MKTRKELYGKEAMEIIRVLSAYKVLYYEQVCRLFPKKRETIEQIIRLLVKQNRIQYDETFDFLYYDNPSPDYRIISCFWVLLDFIEKADYHIPASYPAVISFFAKQEIYEIVSISEGEEKMMQYAFQTLAAQFPAKRIVVVEKPEQIPNCIITGAVGYCTVLQNGTIAYYQIN